MGETCITASWNNTAHSETTILVVITFEYTGCFFRLAVREL